jgi:hypothetical protein
MSHLSTSCRREVSSPWAKAIENVVNSSGRKRRIIMIKRNKNISTNYLQP